jgi:hypothetical protein
VVEAGEHDDVRIVDFVEDGVGKATEDEAPRHAHDNLIVEWIAAEHGGARPKNAQEGPSEASFL